MKKSGGLAVGAVAYAANQWTQALLYSLSFNSASYCMIRPPHPQVPPWLNPHRIVGGKSESWLAKGSSHVETVPQEACRMWASGPGFGTDYFSRTEERGDELHDKSKTP